eukprot:4590497-Lingulodinium_polyedra.AAC.1
MPEELSDHVGAARAFAPLCPTPLQRRVLVTPRQDRVRSASRSQAPFAAGRLLARHMMASTEPRAVEDGGGWMA